MTECKLLFRQALIDATIELADDLQDGKRIAYSAEHRKRMRSIGIAIGLSTKAKVLIALIAAAILLTGCAIFREHITGLLLSFGDGFVNIEGDVNPDAPKEIEHAYVATYIPEGFVEVEREEEWYQIQTVWENSNNEYIRLTQDVIESVGFGTDTEHSANRIINHSDYSIFVVQFNDTDFCYVWSNDNYFFMLDIFTNLTETEVLKIIDSLE